MMLEIWLPFKSNNADGKRIIAHQLRLALPPSGRGSIRYPPEEAGHPDRRTEAQVGTRSPVNPKVRCPCFGGSHATGSMTGRLV